MRRFFFQTGFLVLINKNKGKTKHKPENNKWNRPRKKKLFLQDRMVT